MNSISGRLDPGIEALIYPPPLRVAVIGLSDRLGRPSREVAGALLHWGYDVIPVHPDFPSVLGRTAYATLGLVPRPVDIVDVFRRSDHVRQHLEDILLVRPRLLWLQDGVRDEETAAACRQAGIIVVQDDCLARRIAGLLAAHA